MSFRGKTVLVTGGTSGIGQAAAEQFGSAEAQVIVTGRNKTRGREVLDAIESAGGQARFIAADLTAPDGARNLAHAAGEIDVLINNAGIFPFGPSHEIPIDDVKAVLEFNVVAPFILTAAFVPGMIKRGSGAIVNVSTMVASFGLPGMSAYGASKAALELLTKAWAAEYGPVGVRVNAVAPGPTRTPGRSPWARKESSNSPQLCRSDARPILEKSPTRSSTSPQKTPASSTAPLSPSTAAEQRSNPPTRLTEDPTPDRTTADARRSRSWPACVGR